MTERLGTAALEGMSWSPKPDHSFIPGLRQHMPPKETWHLCGHMMLHKHKYK